jgi:uncharacterized membrane protein YgdD (TMEM256/DUF423 family)
MPPVPPAQIHFQRASSPMTSETACRHFLLLGSIVAGLAVAAGAFGAHMLKAMLDPATLAVYDTAARYQLYHGIGMVLAGLAARLYDEARFAVAGWMFAVGTLLFCGSLYGVALLGIRWLGAVTPLGGLAFIIGWGLLGWRGWRSAGKSPTAGRHP